MSEKLDIQVAINRLTPDIQLGASRATASLSLGITGNSESFLKNYERLNHLPQINGVPLSGDLTTEDLRVVLTDTKANWDENITFIPLAGQVVLYTDYYGNGAPAIKIGDGKAYLIDLPVIGDGAVETVTNALAEHAADLEKHVTSAEKAFWNAKLNCDVDGENLTLNRY